MVLSPHGEREGIYRRVAGDFAALGYRGFFIDHPTDERLVQDLAREWNAEILDASLDHGIVVPLALLKLPQVSVVAASVSSSAGRLSDALTEVLDRPAFVLCSANTSPSLNLGAPLPERPEGAELDERILAALRGNPALLEDIPAELWRAGASCGRAPLTAFGRLFPERGAEVLSYEYPFGVGYLVARSR